MAKGIGLLGNFKGKIGNTVGYKLSASNTGNTQGIRVYQPIVKNPKTAAQAEQRAKLAPINATYRALKMVIDRGNEGLPYGNKSRLAWLKKAFKAEKMPWFVKGSVINAPVACELTRGSLSGINHSVTEDKINFPAEGVTSETPVNTIGAISTILMGANASLKAGDQVTLVVVNILDNNLQADVFSFVLDTTSTVACTGFTAGASSLSYGNANYSGAYAVIISREGANGEHLRSTSSLELDIAYTTDAPYDATSKAAAIESYQNAAGANSDWAEESIQ